MRRLAVAGVMVGVVLAAPSVAFGAITSVLSGQTLSGAGIPCVAQSDGVRVCHGADGGGGPGDLRLKSFDGQPLEVYVILPATPSSGGDGPYPLVIQSHGWPEPGNGGHAAGLSDSDGGPTAEQWASRGYAVLQLTARGFGDSCGSEASRIASPLACAHGYVRLDDDRYEVRDPQYAAGLLVDEGVVDPARIGAVGASYGGGVSFQLATLKDRVMNPDGSLVPWRSPAGRPLRIAAAAPVIPWSDLAYSLVPNGRTLDYQITSPTADLSPIGVMKQSFVSGLFASGASAGYFAPPSSDPQADLTSWFTAVSKGEPYDQSSQVPFIVDQIARYHSAYYLLDGKYGTGQESPPPLLIANGFTDDLFPVDEGVRYYNLVRKLYPSSPIALFDWDGGHQRGQNKPPDNRMLADRIAAFFDRYVKGTGSRPQLGVTALTQTCPGSAPSEGPFTAPTWSALHPGEVVYRSTSSQTIDSSAGDPTIAGTVDPIAGGGACATVSAADQGNGVATYRLPAASGRGYTLLGAPTVIANLSVTGTYAFIAARLWDVDLASNTETLVARGVYRIDPSSPDGTEVFQLHAGAWHFAAGHVPKLELLGQDSPYVRSSNGSFSISVSDLQLRLPVHERPGAPGTPAVVRKPLPHPSLHSHGACAAYPAARINPRRTHASPRRITVWGTASEHRCAHTNIAARRSERVRSVYLIIYRGVGHGRCRFVDRRGRLARTRACSRPTRFRAHGTNHWRLRLNVNLPRGRYTVHVEAIDGLRHHQRRTQGSTVTVTVR